jgi:hypothetical protein
MKDRLINKNQHALKLKIARERKFFRRFIDIERLKIKLMIAESIHFRRRQAVNLNRSEP